jgi:hypothetical protein
MSYTDSLTQTYSVADIGKVIDCIAADLDMNSQSTGLLTRDQVKKYSADVKAMAQKGYLLEANIVLRDSAKKVIRAAKYEVSTDASTLTAQRPGNNLWTRTPSGELNVVVRYSQKWLNLTEVQRGLFALLELSIEWITADTDLSFPSLIRSSDRNYFSNGWGVTKSVYA